MNIPNPTLEYSSTLETNTGLMYYHSPYYTFYYTSTVTDCLHMSFGYEVNFSIAKPNSVRQANKLDVML